MLVGAVTVRLNVEEAEPAEFLAVTVKICTPETISGAPDIRPVDVSNERPLGTFGEMEKLVTVPPVDLTA